MRFDQRRPVLNVDLSRFYHSSHSLTPPSVPTGSSKIQGSASTMATIDVRTAQVDNAPARRLSFT